MTIKESLQGFQTIFTGGWSGKRENYTQFPRIVEMILKNPKKK